MSRGSFGGRSANLTSGVKYVSTQKRNPSNNKNQAGRYMTSLLKSDFDRTDMSGLVTVTEKILKDGCIYIPNFFCKSDDKTIFNKILKELENNITPNPTHQGLRTSKEEDHLGGASSLPGQLVSWSQHLKHENPEFSPTFNEIINKMAKYFKVEIYATRLNYYRDGFDWKPFHHDSHAYIEGKDVREDFTMGASFGDSRELVFLHVDTKNRFSFPQNNGDIFAFNTDVNKKFMHGIPESNRVSGPRISIIAWGKLLPKK